MEAAKTTAFGKKVKKSLVDLEQKQSWLIEQVTEKTGLYFDGSYLHKVMTGQLNTPKVVKAICEILDIQDTPQE